MRRPFHSPSPRTFRADESGAAAVEFSIVAVPFLGIVAAIVQVAFLIWATQNFEQSLQAAVRSVFTGQFQLTTAGQTDATTLLAKLRSRMCGAESGNVATLYDCDGVKIDVNIWSSFSASRPTSPLDPNTGTWNRTFGTQYTCPKPGAIVVVTAAAKIPTLLGLLGVDFRSFADGAHLLLSTSVFRTEPYQTVGTSACAS